MPTANKKAPPPAPQKPTASTATTAAKSSRKRKMEAGEQKYYAVRAGFIPGVYTDWRMCQQQISGFKGAQFKSFFSYDDAAAFAAGRDPPSSLSDAPNRFYGVAVGRKPGVYTDWPTAQKAIVGWKGPKYKRFDTQAEAEAFVKTFAYLNKGNTSEEEILEVEETAAQPPAKKAKKATNSGSAASSVPVIYTDGSSLGNGRLGAAAGVGVYFGPGDPRNIADRLEGDVQTNQRAELTAILRALEVSGDDRDIEIRTDSKYSIQCATEWYVNWERNGWRTAQGPVKNQDLIKAIRARIDARESKGTKTQFIWVKGHASDPGNIAADTLANQGARKPLS